MRVGAHKDQMPKAHESHSMSPMVEVTSGLKANFSCLPRQAPETTHGIRHIVQVSFSWSRTVSKEPQRRIGAICEPCPLTHTENIPTPLTLFAPTLPTAMSFQMTLWGISPA